MWIDGCLYDFTVRMGKRGKGFVVSISRGQLLLLQVARVSDAVVVRNGIVTNKVSVIKYDSINIII